MKPVTYTMPFIGLLFLLISGCNQPEMQSDWKKTAINVDGQPEDWLQVPLYHLEKPPFGIALCNDHEFLYLRLTTHDQQLQQQIRSGGLTVWFDPQGKKEKEVGIGFPTAGTRMPPGRDRGQAENKDGGPPEGRDGGPPEGSGPDDRQRPKQDARFVLTVGGKELGSYPVTKNNFAVSMALGQQQTGLVYELQIPLAAGSLFRQSIVPSTLLGIGLETGKGHPSAGAGEQKQGDSDGGPGGGSSGGPGGGSGGGPGGGSGGGPGGGSGGGPGGGSGGSQQSTLKLWFKVRLANDQPS